MGAVHTQKGKPLLDGARSRISGKKPCHDDAANFGIRAPSWYFPYGDRR